MTKIKNYQPHAFSYNEAKNTSNSSKQVYITYNNEKKPFELSTPTMYLPWQVKGWPNNNGDITKYDITLSFGNMDENPRTKMMYDKIMEFDEKIFNDAIKPEYVQDWFGKKKIKGGLDGLDPNFKRQIRHSMDKETDKPDGKYPPTFKAKLAMWDGKFKFDMFDKEGNKLLINDDERDNSGQILYDPIKLLTGGTKVKCLIQSTGLWFAGGNNVSANFGHGWKVKQLMIMSDITTTTKKCNIEVDSDEEEIDDDANSNIEASDSDDE
jgi:hypothetical protein